MGVDTLHDLGRSVLHFDGARPIHAQNQRGTGPPTSASSRLLERLDVSWPFEPFGQRKGSQILTDDRHPVGQQGRR